MNAAIVLDAPAKPSVPRAFITWLAHAVKVVRPAARRLHFDGARFAKGWHLGNTLGICMSGLENYWRSWPTTEKGLQPLPEAPDGVLVSVPERALLEMLSEVGVHQGIEEARNIMEGARSLRPEVLASLVKNCRRVKVVRLCASWAEELNLSWAAAAKRVTFSPMAAQD